MMQGMVKRIVIIVLAAALIIFFLIPVLRRMEPQRDVVPPPAHDTARVVPPPETPEEPRVRDEKEGVQKPAEWRMVESWEGTGMNTVGPFRIRATQWRIVWETEVYERLGAGVFQIMVYDDKGGLKSVAATTTKTDHGVTGLDGAGTYTLSINTLQNWKVKVEEKS